MGRSVLHSMMVAAFIALGLCIFSPGRSDAEMVQSHSGQYVLTRDSLRIITPAVIRDKGLTLRWDLQEYIAGIGKKARSGLVSVAVVDPESGEILALYGRDASGENCSLSLNTYQAASLFKVVTATAAIDYAGMTVK
ncbi:hypothetical protein EG833_02275, partial [archaeon]|nr:hypothetical protein [archaeon]